jgi:hypothetical protein
MKIRAFWSTGSVEAVSNLSKMSGMCINHFIYIYSIHLCSSIFLTVYLCFTFHNYTGTSEFPF